LIKKTLTCTCGGIVSYKTDSSIHAAFIDKLFYDLHVGEGHEVTEQPTYICEEGY
jgi:hypothetical protein